jgi:hypothetical protein
MQSRNKMAMENNEDIEKEPIGLLSQSRNGLI